MNGFQIRQTSFQNNENNLYDLKLENNKNLKHRRSGGSHHLQYSTKIKNICLDER